MIPSKVIRDVLVASDAFDGWTIRVGSEPAKPHNMITCRDVGGPAANPKFLLDFPSVQVTVRAPADQYGEGYNAAKRVKDACLGIAAQDVDGGRIDSITLGSDIFYIGEDSNQCHKFSVTFDMILEPEASAYTNREAL